MLLKRIHLILILCIVIGAVTAMMKSSAFAAEFDFEKDAGLTIIKGCASITNKGAIGGARSVLIDTTASTAVWNPCIMTPAIFKPGTGYLITMNIKLIEAGDDSFVHIIVRPLDAPDQRFDACRYDVYGMKDVGVVRHIRLKCRIQDDKTTQVLQIHTRKKVRALIDDIVISEHTSQPLAASVITDEPIFGLYALVDDKRDIDLVADSPFQYLIPYGTDIKEEAFLEDYLTYASKKGVRIFFSLASCYKGNKWYPKTKWCPTDDESRLVECIVGRFRDHKSIYGWYIADEPTTLPFEVGMENIDKVEKNALAIKKLSSKPILFEDFAFPRGKLWEYAVDFSDILMTTSYPVPERGLDEAYMNVRSLTSKYNKPVISILQAFGKYEDPSFKRDKVTGRFPTISEIKAMSYLSLLAGAKGIFYYSLMNIKKLPNSITMLDSLKKLAKELKEKHSLIASTEKVSEDYDISMAKGVYAKITHHGGRDYLIAVNSTNENKDVAILQKNKSAVIRRKGLRLASLEVKIAPVRDILSIQ